MPLLLPCLQYTCYGTCLQGFCPCFDWPLIAWPIITSSLCGKGHINIKRVIGNIPDLCYLIISKLSFEEKVAFQNINKQQTKNQNQKTLVFEVVCYYFSNTPVDDAKLLMCKLFLVYLVFPQTVNLIHICNHRAWHTSWNMVDPNNIYLVNELIFPSPVF